ANQPEILDVGRCHGRYSRPGRLRRSIIGPESILGSKNVLTTAKMIPLPVDGPESLDWDPRGEGPYVGVTDGRILKWRGSDLGWVEFAYSSPPQVGPKGGLAEKVVDEVEGQKIMFANQMDIDEEEDVFYFNDSSDTYHFGDVFFAFLCGEKTGRAIRYDKKSKEAKVIMDRLHFPNGLAISKDGSFVLSCEIPKLPAYVSSPSSTSATASARPKNTSKSFSLSLSIRSASVSLSLYRRPHSYLIVILHVPETLVSKATCMDIFHNNKYSLALQVYTTPAQHLDSTWYSPLNSTSASATTSATTSEQTSYIFRYWAKGPKAGTRDVFAKLPGYADNIRTEKGDFWIALHSNKTPFF
uniref:Strictosidine synthase conserved region domain-containing protein n=1 Tax=Brassica oleracea var. oleracea TaxID=109376 RepID=A0A0D3B680_BRAOL